MKIQAVIFDWAGTVVDAGCHAPVAVLERIFAARGVPLQPAESRHAMGLLKIDQIRAITQLPRVSEAWRGAHGSEPGETEVRRLFDAFVPLQLDCIEEYSDVIPGVPEMVERLRSAGIRIGSTTGYTRPMLDRLLPKAARQGYAPDVTVTPDEVGGGRPYPWMIFENMRRLSVFPPSGCLKVGDTPSDIEEGRNAGVNIAGVRETSSDAALHGGVEAERILRAAGARHILATAAGAMDLLEQL